VVEAVLQSRVNMFSLKHRRLPHFSLTIPHHCEVDISYALELSRFVPFVSPH
jgi:hypothetical protein